MSNRTGWAVCIIVHRGDEGLAVRTFDLPHVYAVTGQGYWSYVLLLRWRRVLVPGWTRGRRHAVALVIRCYQAEGYSGRDVVVIAGKVTVRATCRSTVPQRCFDGRERRRHS